MNKYTVTIFAGGMSAGIIAGSALSMPVNHFVFVLGGAVAGVMMCSFVTLVAIIKSKD